MSIEPNTVIVQAENMASNAVDEDLVILNLARDSYVALDAIGRRIWEWIESPQRVEEVCRRLCREFSGPPEQITADALRFLNELNQEGMIHVVDARST